MADDGRDSAALLILEFVREHKDEMGWTGFGAIEAGTGLDQNAIIDGVEKLCAMGVLICRLRWCTPERSWAGWAWPAIEN
jgi:hypothetical protein